MPRRPLIVIVPMEERGDYGAFSLPDERVEFMALGKGVEAVDRSAPELVILDCGSYPERGMEILLEIKRLRSDLPVIFLTAESSEEIIIRAFKTGVREYFRKPVSMTELSETAQEILRLKRETSGKRLPLAVAKRMAAPEEVPLLTGDVPAHLRRVVRHMSKNLTNPLCLNSFAQEACLSKFHFCRQFKKHTGMSPMQFMVRLRIGRAMDLLRHSDLKISVLAIQAGFNNLSEFNKQFKKVTGATPSAYRASSP